LIAGVLPIIDILSIIYVNVIAVEVVVDVAIDVYVRMVAPAPATSVSPVAVVCNNCAGRHTQTETDRCAGHWIIWRIDISWIRHWITGIND
jgi:hypothetical protein